MKAPVIPLLRYTLEKTENTFTQTLVPNTTVGGHLGGSTFWLL